jgi:fused-like protein
MNIENKRSHDDALINALQISSQLARHSEQFFAALTKVYTIYKLGYILTNDNPVIRAKGCNLIGNLCRHSDRFYTVLVTKINHGQSHTRNSSSLLDLLCNCCGDSDPNTRKFASFAGKC